MKKYQRNIDVRGIALNQKLEKPYFPAGVVVSYAAIGDESIKEKALANAIPEFMRFNIVESDVRNVYR